jgi:hypothetical protein
LSCSLLSLWPLLRRLLYQSLFSRADALCLARKGYRMYRVWYWAVIDRESDGRFIASITDLDDLTAYGHTDKDAVVHVAEPAGLAGRAPGGGVPGLAAVTGDFRIRVGLRAQPVTKEATDDR